MAGFQRVDQLSAQEPWGPPWMRKARGYFLAGSKVEGLRTQAWMVELIEGFEAGARKEETWDELRPREEPLFVAECVQIGEVASLSPAAWLVLMMLKMELSMRELLDVKTCPLRASGFMSDT